MNKFYFFVCLLVTVSTDRNSFSGLTAVTRVNTLLRTEEQPDLDCLDLERDLWEQ